MEGAEKWFDYAWIARGHEDLTRMAVDAANDLLEQKGEGEFLFPKVPYGDAGVSSHNPLVKGNFSTDFPNLGMKAYYEPTSLVGPSWGSNTQLQLLHFLRNYSASSPRSVMSLEDTCQQGRDLIIKNTLWAFTHFRITDSYKQSDLHDGILFWFGHVLHTIQDSFSPAHVHRAPPDFRRIEDICVYGERFSSTCYHHKMDFKDRIWNNNLVRCFVGPYRGRACLKGRAKAAVDASAGYLVTVAQLTKVYAKMAAEGTLAQNQSEWEALVTGHLQNYLSDEKTPYFGYFNCPGK